jgi:uncharacterized membrane protein
MKIRYYYITLAIIILAGFFIRIYSLGHESLWGDEFYSYYVSSSGINNMFEYISSDYHPPLYYILLNIFINLLGPSEFNLRLISVITGSLSVIAIYQFMKRFSNKRSALIAAALFAFSPLAVSIDREARMYSLFILLTTMSMMYFLLITRENTVKNSMLYIVFSALMLYTHGFSLIVLFLQLSYLFIDLIHPLHHPKREREEAKLPKCYNLKHWLINVTVSLLLFSPWAIVFMGQMRNMNKYFWVHSRDVLFLGRFIIEFSGTITSALIFTLLAGLLVYKQLKKRQKSETKSNRIPCYIRFQ